MLPKKIGRLHAYSKSDFPPGFDFQGLILDGVFSQGDPPYGYFWNGGAIVAVDGRITHRLGIESLETGQVLNIGPYCVRVMARWARADAYIVIRESRMAAIRVALYRAQLWVEYNIVGPLYRRGAKQGWITPSEYVTAAWRDVNAIDWVARKLGR